MIQEFIQYTIKIKGYSSNTAIAYEKDLRAFAKWAQQQHTGITWRTITRETIDEYLTDEVGRGLKASTTNRRLAAISSLYNYMKRQGLEVENPVRYESRRKVEERVPNTIDMKDLEKAYNKATGVARHLLGILITTGARIQEVLDITWEDIDFKRCSIKLHGKGKKERIVYTLPQVTEELHTIYEWSRKIGNVFTIDQRTARQIIFRALQHETRAAQKSPHAIRHTVATHLAAEGVNTSSLQTILGHKDIRTTQKYIDFGQNAIDVIMREHAILH